VSLVQKSIGNTTYYTDGVNYYTFHVVRSKDDALWKFACIDLGIVGKPTVTEQQARVNDLAGTGVNHRTKYLLLKNGQAVAIPYHNTGNAILNVNDVILRRVAPPPSVGLVKCPHCASSVLPGPVCSMCGGKLTP
jgi:hypothetical protein